MTEQPYTPDFTKTGDVFVSRDGTEWQFRNDAKCATQPITLSRIKNTSDSSSFWTSGRYVTDRTEHDLDIVSQYTPVAPERDVPQEIPQWCRFAFKELRDNGFISSPHSKECLTSDAVCRIIARHAPKVETDAEGNELPIQDRVTALRTRAEAAEAKCAEQKRFAESMLAQAMDSQAQLAAANGSLADMTNKFMDAHKELAAATERVAALEKERDGLRELLQEVREAFADGTLTSGPGNGKGKRYAIGIAAGIELALSQTKGWE